ncbi:amidohydrolase family protein, partial [Vibrio sp. 1866]|uniref:amidohydrolase family protein n=1 Tax=Vibrio sp. 1866 TaxID=3074581 RepID=UPI002964E51F
IDLVAYAEMVSSSDFMDSEYNTPEYTNHFRIGGVKLNFDGSPQGKTAWLSQPYFHPPHGQDKDYAGYPTFEDKQAYDYVETAFKNEWQVLTHANGDAAIEQFINAVTKANEKLGKQDRRPVLIHGQTMRQDQGDRLAAQGIFPSLFPMHTFYWGDWHVDSVLGHPRADFISPTQA